MGTMPAEPEPSVVNAAREMAGLLHELRRKEEELRSFLGEVSVTRENFEEVIRRLSAEEKVDVNVAMPHFLMDTLSNYHASMQEEVMTEKRFIGTPDVDAVHRH